VFYAKLTQTETTVSIGEYDMANVPAGNSQLVSGLQAPTWPTLGSALLLTIHIMSTLYSGNIFYKT